MSVISSTSLAAEAVPPHGSEGQSLAISLGFVDHTVSANGIRLHYVTAGKGEPVVLLPGWPEDWYAWRYFMKEMVENGREVYALDPRGFGDSERPADGYDLATSAKDIHAFIEAVGLKRAGGVDIVAHDVGTWLAYAHASAYPEDVRRLVVSEALIPWSTPPEPTPDDPVNVKTWHFGFNRLNDLPEILIQGHERAYLSWLFSNRMVRVWRLDPAALDEYVRVLSAPGGARTSFAYYRQAFNEQGKVQMQAWLAHKLPMPVLALGAGRGFGDKFPKIMQVLATNVHTGVFEGCGHFLAEECPNEFAHAVLAFWKEVPVS